MSFSMKRGVDYWLGWTRMSNIKRGLNSATEQEEQGLY